MKASLINLKGPAPFATAAALIGYGAALFASPVLNDPDTYWHIKTGEWILRNGAVPHTDPFSFTFWGKPWVVHEWLSELLMALAYRVGAWNGIAILFGAATALTAWLLASQLSRRLKQPAAFVVLALSAACISPSLLARPHLLALPVLVLWVSGLLSGLEKGERPSLWLLPLMTLWASLHGTFAFGLALIFPVALEALAREKTDWARLARGWGAFLAASVGMAFLTPNGWNGLTLPYQLIRMKLIGNIGEWAPLDFHQLQPLELALMAMLYLAFTRPVRLPLPRLLTLIGLMHLALQHSRHQMLAGVVGALILARPLGDALGGAPQADAASASTIRWMAAGLLVAALLTALRIAHPIVRTDDRVSPITALNRVPAEIRRQPVLNSYQFGGYLIFNDIQPFIDGRAELYGDNFVFDYLSALTPHRAAFERMVDQYGIRWAILSSGSPLLDLIDTLPHWRRLYADRVAVVYVRDEQ